MIPWLVAIGFFFLWLTEVGRASELQCIIDDRDNEICWLKALLKDVNDELERERG